MDGRETYSRVLGEILGFRDALTEIAISGVPSFRQDWLPGLDAAALYTMIRAQKPSSYVEIGSGHSTLFARAAVNAENISTVITSIDPKPRTTVRAAVDHSILAPLEKADLSVFAELRENDIVFFDGSHRCFTNSDVTVFFLEVLPSLHSGVLVQIHDIFLPDDYPPEWNDRYYSEQYMLACLLLSGCTWIEPLLPVNFVLSEPGLKRLVDPLWQDPAMQGFNHGGGSFWFRIR